MNIHVYILLSVSLGECSDIIKAWNGPYGVKQCEEWCPSICECQGFLYNQRSLTCRLTHNDKPPDHLVPLQRRSPDQPQEEIFIARAEAFTPRCTSVVSSRKNTNRSTKRPDEKSTVTGSRLLVAAASSGDSPEIRVLNLQDKQIQVYTRLNMTTVLCVYYSKHLNVLLISTTTPFGLFSLSLNGKIKRIVKTVASIYSVTEDRNRLFFSVFGRPTGVAEGLYLKHIYAGNVNFVTADVKKQILFSCLYSKIISMNYLGMDVRVWVEDTNDGLSGIALDSHGYVLYCGRQKDIIGLDLQHNSTFYVATLEYVPRNLVYYNHHLYTSPEGTGGIGIINSNHSVTMIQNTYTFNSIWWVTICLAP